MRAHTALHLLSVALPYPVTGGSVGDAEGRLDFDCEATLDKAEVERKLNDLIALDAPVGARWITDEELDANPALVKTMAVKPPRGAGEGPPRRRSKAMDLQPCGGTHVARTGEIGRASVTQIEKKGGSTAACASFFPHSERRHHPCPPEISARPPNSPPNSASPISA